MTKTIHFLLLLLFFMTALPSWAEDEAPTAPTAIYYAIPEPFTINFLNQSNKKVRYLQIKVTLMAHDQEVIDNAKLNLPMLQDALRSLFSEQSFETVSTIKGRKTLQADALKTIKTILKQETANDKLDAVYFTSFILQ